MTLVLHQSDIGEQLREPTTLPRRRRRLSTVARDRIPGRPCIVSIHRCGSPLMPTNETVRQRKAWKNTLVGPEDVVVVTYLPRGGGGGQGGGKSIIGALAMIALSVVAPMIVGALGPAFAAGGSLTLLGKIATAGLIAGVGYFVSKALQPKANKEEEQRPVYGVQGGGNLPRPGDRIPVHYGRLWITPDLSQNDYFYYEGEDQVLLKRMTIGAGEYDLHAIRTGAAIMYQNGSFRAPFTTTEIEIIEPGKRSKLVPSSVYSSEQVNGSEVPRPNDGSGVDWMGPFPVTEAGVTTNRIQIDHSLPQGLYAVMSKNGKKSAHVAAFIVEYAEIDDDDRVIGPWRVLLRRDHILNVTRAQRFTDYINVTEGRYAARARNANPKYEGDNYTPYDTVTWDGLRAHLDREPLRPNVTELAMRIRSGKATGTISAYSNLEVEISRKVPVWNGVTWVTQRNRKAVWAALDVLRNRAFGYGADDSKIDLATFYHYATTVNTYDTFDGTIRGPVAVSEALLTILGVMRGEPTLVGDVWSMTRDEPRDVRKHVITRRQIVRDSSGVEFDLDMSDGSSDIIVEWFSDGDPNKRQEHRVTIGEETLTPRRMNLFGVTTFAHAEHLGKWYAAAAYYRREHRLFSTELLGRNLGRNDAALIDTWFLDEGQAAGVESVSGYDVTLDTDIPLPAGAHAVFRNEQGREWGPVAVTTTGDPDTIRVNTSDAAVVEQWTGQPFYRLFQKARRKLPVTVLIGTLAELTQPYLIRTVRPDANGTAQISAVIDADEVWHVLGENPAPEPPITEVIRNEGDLLPILPWVRAQAVQKATALMLDWAVAPTRGATNYVVEIRYEDEDAGEAWETIHNGPATEGLYPLDYRAGVTVRVRARAFNPNGVPSEPKYTVVTLFKPVITPDIADMLIELEMLQGQVRKDIESITKLGRDTLRGALKDLADRVEELANATATEAGNSYESRELVKVAVGNAFAAIKRETEIRIEENMALARTVETMVANLGDISEAGLTEERQVRASTDEALSQQITTLRADLGTSAASFTSQLEARTGPDSALAQQVNVLSSTVGGQSVTLTQQAASINGVRAEYGVAVEADGNAVGGYRLSAIRKLDGTWSSQFGIHGDLVVTGTISGTKLQAANIITGSAQIGTGIITNAHIANAQITNAKIGNAEIDHLKVGQGALTQSEGLAGNAYPNGFNFDVSCRAGGKAVVLVSFNGASNINASDVPSFTVYCDGAVIGTFTASSITYQWVDVYGNGQTTTHAHATTRQFIVNNNTTKTRNFRIVANASASCVMTVLEFAR